VVAADHHVVVGQGGAQEVIDRLLQAQADLGAAQAGPRAAGQRLAAGQEIAPQVRATGLEERDRPGRSGRRPRVPFSPGLRYNKTARAILSFHPAREKSRMQRTDPRGRIQEIDIAKGMACFLMLTSHFVSAKLLPFGTFAAPLFFACSGMNTILLIERTKDNRRYDLFHLLFPVLLFLGGSTQVVIAHGGRLRLFPEFLQVIALSVLMLFVLGRLFAEPHRCGILFPIPFLVQQLVPGDFLRSCIGTPLGFIFGNGFVLFPWLGFFLFGVFLLRLRRDRVPWLLAVLSLAFVLSFAAARVPLEKFWMSSSYMLLALTAVTLLFWLARRIAAWGGKALFRGVGGLFALAGRNALMFVYLHYFALRYLRTAQFLAAESLHFMFQAFYLYFACLVFLKFYEKVKSEREMFFPALALGVAMAALRWGGWLRPQADARLTDMIIGVLFAFLYVQLRRRFAAICDRRRPSV
jgi:hypothetical protein